MEGRWARLTLRPPRSSCPRPPDFPLAATTSHRQGPCGLPCESHGVAWAERRRLAGRHDQADPKRPTSAVSSIAPTTTRWRRRTARTDHTHMQEKLHCDNTLHQSHQEGPQLPDARLRQQREAIEGEDSVVRPQFVLARATWRATQTGHGSGNPSASWKERTSCHGEWQRSSARLRRRARKKNGRN